MYKIVKIHKKDAFYQDRKQIVGLIGIFEKCKWQAGIPKGFVAGDFRFPNKVHLGLGDDFDEAYFYAVKLEEVE